VTRRDDGGITLHGTPQYAGSQAGQQARAALWTAHTLAQTQIAPLLELAAPLRTGAQRDALAAYVIRRLHTAWGTRTPPGSRH
jgi:hypothetical protein